MKKYTSWAEVVGAGHEGTIFKLGSKDNDSFRGILLGAGERMKAVSLVLILCCGAACSCSKPDWPESGKRDIRNMLAIDDFSFDCYQSSWSKENVSKLGGLGNVRSLGTNLECEYNSEEILWTVFPEAVNATFRCKRSGVTGEYTVTVFPTTRTPFGDYYCNAAHFDSSENFEIGSVTDVLSTYK